MDFAGSLLVVRARTWTVTHGSDFQDHLLYLEADTDSQTGESTVRMRRQLHSNPLVTQRLSLYADSVECATGGVKVSSCSSSPSRVPTGRGLR